MKVGVISDTHDHLPAVEKAVSLFREHGVEQIIHCGDWSSPYTLFYFGSLVADWKIPVFSVFGNNEGDYRKILDRNAALKYPITFPEVSVLELSIGDKNCAVYHGHDTPTLDALILCGKYHAVFTGHTHVVRNEFVHNVLVLNPGSTSYFSGGKVVDTATIAIYDSSAHTAEILTL